MKWKKQKKSHDACHGVLSTVLMPLLYTRQWIICHSVLVAFECKSVQRKKKNSFYLHHQRSSRLPGRVHCRSGSSSLGQRAQWRPRPPPWISSPPPSAPLESLRCGGLQDDDTITTQSFRYITIKCKPGILHVCVKTERSTWVVHEGPFAIGLFDLVLGGVLADPQHLVVIFPLALLQLQLCRLQQMLVI